jgi:hypothetical protein
MRSDREHTNEARELYHALRRFANIDAAGGPSAIETIERYSATTFRMVARLTAQLEKQGS